MGYIEYLNGFNVWLESHALEPVPQLLYFKLLNIFNRAGWPESVQVDNQRIMSVTGQKTEKSAIAARDKLISSGLIFYQRGKKGCPGRYFINTEIYSKNYSVNNTVENIHCKKSAFPVNNEGCNTGIIGEEERQTYKTNTKKKTKTKNEDYTPKSPLQNENTGSPSVSVSGNDPELARVMTELLNLIPEASPMAIEEIRGFYADMGADVCIRAIWVARDERKASWQFIRGILRNRKAQGVRNIADWDRADADWQSKKTRKSEDKPFVYDPGDTTGSL